MVLTHKNMETETETNSLTHTSDCICLWSAAAYRAEKTTDSQLELETVKPSSVGASERKIGCPLWNWQRATQ